MGAPQEVLELLEKGLSPGQIRQRRADAGRGSSVNTIIPYIDSLIGSGRIRRSDVIFNINKDLRRHIEAAIERDSRASDAHIVAGLVKAGLAADPADVAAFRRYGDARFSLSDMYDDIVRIETQLHHDIRQVLENAYGSAWWTKGVPTEVRADCSKRAPRNLQGTALYPYTTIMNLHDIIKSNTVFAGRLAPWDRDGLNSLLARLTRLNRLRNTVMHPVRYRRPTEDDFQLTNFLARHIGFK